MNPEVLHVMYSFKKCSEEGCDYVYTLIHGIFTDKEIKKYRDVRQRLGVESMSVPLNKFVESGVEL